MTDLSPVRHHRWTAFASRHWYGLVLGVIAAAGAAMRIGFNTRPGYDVDESLYAAIAARLAETGQLQAKAEYIGQAVPYTSHPPVLFWVEAGWFKLAGSGIVQARLLSAVAGVATILVAAWLLRRLVGKEAGLLAAVFVAFDGWLIFTNRVGWAENVQIPLGLAALWVFWWLCRQPANWARLFAGGLVLGAITAYKLVGVTFLLGGLLYLLIERYRFRQCLAVVGGAVSVVGAYAFGMWLWVGNQFLSDNYHQFQRATGIVKSRGTVQTGGSSIGLFVGGPYSIYLASIALLGLIGLLLGVRVLQCLRHRSLGPAREANSLLFAWAFVSFVLFGLGPLRLPHYLIMVIAPGVCYLAAELVRWFERKPQAKARVRMAMALVLLVVVGGVVSYAGRIILRSDNAVGDTLAWMADEHNAPRDAKVIADEFIGNQLGQPYCKVTHAQLCEQRAGRPRFIIAYETTTQKLPESQALTRMLGYGTVVAEFTGFKEHIRIYQIAPASQ